MLDLCFDHAQGGFQPCLRFASKVHKVSFGRRSCYIWTVAQNLFQPCSSYVLTDLRYVSTMHEVYFDCRSRYASTVFEMCFNRARGIFRPSLVVCFDLRAQFVSTMLEICLRQCSRYASTVHKVCFDRARGMFQLT